MYAPVLRLDWGISCCICAGYCFIISFKALFTSSGFRSMAMTDDTFNPQKKRATKPLTRTQSLNECLTCWCRCNTLCLNWVLNHEYNTTATNMKTGSNIEGVDSAIGNKIIKKNAKMKLKILTKKLRIRYMKVIVSKKILFEDVNVNRFCKKPVTIW